MIVGAGIGLLALVAAMQPIAAADLPRKALVYKAPPVPVWTWDGWYVGGNVGYSWGNWDSTCPYRTNCFPVNDGAVSGAVTGVTTAAGLAAAVAFINGASTNSASPNVNGWVGGIQFGRNWQYQNWVIGFESDLSATGERRNRDGSATFRFVDVDGGTTTATLSSTNSWKFNWFGTLRGRLGWASDTWLAYVTGGLAVGNASYSHSTTASATVTPAGGATASATLSSGVLSDSTTQVGFAVGAGVEKAFTRNLVGRLEYLYIDLGSHRFLDGVIVRGTRYDTDVKLRDNIVRAGLSYLFNSGPVVAKY